MARMMNHHHPSMAIGEAAGGGGMAVGRLSSNKQQQPLTNGRPSMPQTHRRMLQPRSAWAIHASSFTSSSILSSFTVIIVIIIIIIHRLAPTGRGRERDRKVPRGSVPTPPFPPESNPIPPFPHSHPVHPTQFKPKFELTRFGLFSLYIYRCFAPKPVLGVLVAFVPFRICRWLISVGPSPGR